MSLKPLCKHCFEISWQKPLAYRRSLFNPVIFEQSGRAFYIAGEIGVFWRDREAMIKIEGLETK